MTFWTIAKNDLKINIKDKMFLFWLIVFPLIFAVVFGFAFPSSSSGLQQVALNIIDHDQTILSQALIKELEGEKYAVKVIAEESEKNIRTLIIPKNFTQKVIAGEKVELILEKEEDSNIRASQAAYSHILKAIIKVLTKIIAVQPKDENDLAARYNEVHLERMISIKSELGGRLKTIPGGFNHTIPAVSIMFILFTVLLYGGILLQQERRRGQLERIYLSPATFTSIISGKWLSRFLLGMLQIFILFLVGKFIFKIYLGTSIPALFLVALFFCGTTAGLSILVGSVFKKEEILIVFTILLANLLAALGGCWIPIELFPEGLRTASFALPTAWAMDAFHKLIFFGYSLEAVWLNILVLFITTLVLLFFAVRFFKLRKT